MLPGSTRPPHYRQSKPGACLPACTRMVLAALGDERSETELAKLMGSKAIIIAGGTPT